MKKRDRQIKKWTKRFIDPVVSGLPKTEYFAHKQYEDGTDVQDDNNRPMELIWVIGNNHTIVNGVRIDEGDRNRNYNRPLMVNIRETGLKAKEIVDSHKWPHLRVVTIRSSSCRLRLITE